MALPRRKATKIPRGPKRDLIGGWCEELARQHSERKALEDLGRRSDTVARLRNLKPPQRPHPSDRDISEWRNRVANYFRGRPRGFRLVFRRHYAVRKQILKTVADKFHCTPRMADRCWKEWRAIQKRISEEEESL